MKPIIITMLAAMLLATPAAASEPCGASPSLTEFVQGQVELFAKDGVKLDPVYMKRPQLDAFIKATKQSIADKGGDPNLYDESTALWETLVWAKISNGTEEAIGIVVADKNGCVLEADNWSVDFFFEIMKAAFGVDA